MRSQGGIAYTRLLQLLALHALGPDYLKLGDRARREHKLEHIRQALARSHRYTRAQLPPPSAVVDDADDGTSALHVAVRRSTRLRFASAPAGS
jgi:hypothetical protein